VSSRKSFIAGGAAVAAAGFASRASAAPEPPPYASVVTLGVCAPFTGDFSTYGEQIANGVRQACEDSNQLHGIMDRQFQLRTFDDQNLLADGIVTAGFACDDPTVMCVIGHLSGHITEAAAHVYAQKGMSLIVPVSTFDRLTEDALGNILRLPTKDSTEGRLTGKYVETKMKPAKVSICYQDGDYGVDVADGFAQQLSVDKVPFVTVEMSYAKPNFPGAVERALAPRPDVVYLAGNVGDMGDMIHLLRAAGFSGGIAASKGFFDQMTLKKYGPDLGQFAVATPLPPLELAPTVYQIRMGFEQRYGAGTFTFLAAFGYAAAQIAIAAIRRSGTNDRLALLRQLQLPAPYDTCVGSFEFLPAGDPVEPNVYFYGIRDGKFRYDSPAVTTGFLVR
jgi:branched-chain amino acid transport system substrate-binding protein